MIRKTVSVLTLTLLSIGMLAFSFKVQPVKSIQTIYIRGDGKIDPPTANITSSDNTTYTFTGDNYDASIIVERSNIIIDGAGCELEGVGSGAGIWLSERNNITIRNIEIKSFDAGVFLYKSSYITISNNNISDNYFYGIGLNSCSNSSVSRNIVANNTNMGVAVWNFSKNNIIQENKIMENLLVGIQVTNFSSHNILDGNYIARNHRGIELANSTNNNITANNIINCDMGISFYWSSTINAIYHNNLIDNQICPVENIYADPPSPQNTWDDGHPSGGNYWSDYTGVDFLSGPYQNETGSDGLGDTPYVIDENNTDNYPLMKPYSGPYDIGITNLVTSKTVVGQGFEVQINASVLNYGNSTENFNLTAYGNTTAIASKNVTLENRNSTTVIFTWNTTGRTKGNYTITVEATPVPSETNTADNTFTSGIIKVVILGDINGDGTVDVFDAVILSGAAGSQPGSSNWNPNADLNGDLTTDVFDAVILSRHAGEADL